MGGPAGRRSELEPAHHSRRERGAGRRRLPGHDAAARDLEAVHLSRDLLGRREERPLDGDSDRALDLGVVRVRENGSHGGHNGLRSVIDALGTDEFCRVRVGIRKGDFGPDLADFVLSDFPKDDVLVVQEAVGWAAEAVHCLVREGAPVAMNRFNGARKT
jgi:PTH1 family peptidyl-tRNA hydrolase